jgi:ubiquinone/menaquinone biosynthesis C-methylase UbiE
MYARLIAAVLAAVLSIAPQQPATKRQPAPVMGSQGAGWLVRAERIQEEQPDQMLKALDIKPGSVVADVGAGVGYHVWRLAEIVGPAGKVFAEDIQPEMLRLLERNISDRRLQNVQIVLGTEKDPKLPAAQVDLVLMVDVYHEFSDPVSMMQNIRKSLKPDGRVVLVEFRKEDDRVPIRPEHKMSTQGVRDELEPLGFKFDKAIEFLPWQHILIFSVTNPL